MMQRNIHNVTGKKYVIKALQRTKNRERFRKTRLLLIIDTKTLKSGGAILARGVRKVTIIIILLFIPAALLCFAVSGL